MYSNNIVNFQESTTILNASTKKFWKLIEGTPYIYMLEFMSELTSKIIECRCKIHNNPVEYILSDVSQKVLRFFGLHFADIIWVDRTPTRIPRTCDAYCHFEILKKANSIKRLISVSVSLFNGISTFVCYLMQK